MGVSILMSTIGLGDKITGRSNVPKGVSYKNVITKAREEVSSLGF